MSIDDERKHISNLLKDTQALEVSTGVFKRRHLTAMDLDILVAVRVMGYGNVEFDETLPPPPYSTDIRAAFAILKKLEKTYAVSVGSQHPGWRCSVMEHGSCKTVAIEVAATAPHAICLAALKAMGGA